MWFRRLQRCSTGPEINGSSVLFLVCQNLNGSPNFLIKNSFDSGTEFVNQNSIITVGLPLHAGQVDFNIVEWVECPAFFIQQTGLVNSPGQWLDKIRKLVPTVLQVYFDFHNF